MSVFLNLFSKKKDNSNPTANNKEFVKYETENIKNIVEPVQTNDPSHNANKKSGFNFLTKNKNKLDSESSVKNISNDNDSQSIHSSSNQSSSTPNNNVKPNSFKFIKSKNINSSKENISNEINKKSDFLSLDNLLNEKESYFNSMLANSNQDIIIQNSSLNSNLKEESNYNDKDNYSKQTVNINDVLTNTGNINNNSNSNSNRESISFIHQQPASEKTGFKFLKKKAPLENNSCAEAPKEKEFETIHNINNLDDLNSDTKSFKSLRLNNNIKQDNISLNLDKDDEDRDRDRDRDSRSITSKSIKNLNINNTSTTPRETGVNLSNNKLVSERKNSGLSDKKSNIFNTNNPEQMKKRCYDEINKSEDSVKDLVANIHELKSELKSKEKTLENLNKESESLYEQEEEAITNNNFDEAQNIENIISDIKRKIEKVNRQVDEIKNEMITYREQELLIIRNKWKILEETCNSFTKLKSGQEYELETFQNTDMNRHKNDNIKIKKLKEKLDFLKTNLDSDKNFIDEEEEKITKVIKSQSSGVFEEMDELNKTKSTVLDEIETLKKLLDQKYLELDIVERAIETKEIEIDAIKSNFNHEFNKLNYKKKNYEESLKDFGEQENQYYNMVKVYQSDEIKFDQKMKNMKSSISELENELIQFKSTSCLIFEDLNKKEYLLKNENEILSKIHLIDMKYEKTNLLKEENLENIQKLELNSKKLEAKILGMDMKIPTLEEEKRGYVTLKNFKEAGRVSNELKTIIENKNKNIIKIEDNKNQIQTLKINNENINSELNKIKESKSIEEQDLNITKYEYLISYREQFENLYNSLKNKNTNKSDLEKIEEEFIYIEHETEFLERFEYILEKFPKKIVEVEVEEINTNEELEKEIGSSDNVEISQNIQNSLIEGEKSIIDGDGEDDKDEDQEVDLSKEDELKEENNEASDDINVDISEVKNQVGHHDGNSNKEEINTEEEVNVEEIEQRIQELNTQLENFINEEDFENADLTQKEIDLLSLKLNK